MTRKTSIFIFLGLIFTFTIWMMDRASLVAVSWRKVYFEFSIPEAMLFLLVIFAVIAHCPPFGDFCRYRFVDQNHPYHSKSSA